MPTKRPIPPLYGGYCQTDEFSENKELTHVGPGTPGGEYLRCFWHPVALESEVTDVPLVIRILSEDLVLFRDTVHNSRMVATVVSLILQLFLQNDHPPPNRSPIMFQKQ